ncbi:S41 family peptidase [Psychrobacter sp. PP-21]|uniref:S41 family peptidase n=1 Tax=Psychrobacter sp. PP-21 TaxID=2957503 RepID=UPI0029A4CDDC|nr:S41 family peptidase [Psychrobacter sp. PP-21]MDX2373260.1 S41 family peptidase [Psychrobacter sp. PP-21]
MPPISLMRSSLSKQLGKKALRSSIANSNLKPSHLKPSHLKPKSLSSVDPKRLLALGLLGWCVASTSAQAAVPTDAFTPSPTASLQLISLNADAVASENDIDMLAAADESDDSIDSAPDESALMDDTDSIDTSIPPEVQQVSLNAISPETLKTFVAVVDLVRRQYIDAVNDEELFNNAMSGMLTKLDSHAEFLDAEAYENLRAFTEGDVGDIGIKVTYQADAGYWVVTDVIDDSPADKKGIAVGDYLHQIDEFKLDENRKSNDIDQLLTGIAGTQVDIITSKAGRRKHTTTLQRNNSHPQVIQTKLVDGMAVIKLPAFQNNSREKLLEGLIDLNAPISGVLLDMRDNPGGVLTSAVSVASLFMSDTDVVQVQARQDQSSVLPTQGNALLKPLPMVVLQNRYSASAAEVLASSLQAQKRATIVGEVSYGKGSVQSVIPLNDEQAVKLTVANYMTASGRQIDGIGVEPDVSLSGNESTWEEQALSLLKARALDSGIRFVRKATIQ